MLVGTVSVEKSEVVANMLKAKGMPFNVLNAKQHEREASIVAQAGRKGAITISTNMAGRGTDILLGGNPEVMAKDALAEEKAKLAEEAAPTASGEGDDGEAKATAPYRGSSAADFDEDEAAQGADRGVQGSSARPSARKCSPPAASRSSAPSATSRAASTTSCAAAPVARAIRARRGSTCR